MAFTELKGIAPNAQQPVYDLKVVDLAAGTTRTLRQNVYLSYGIEISWSPNSDRLAYVASGQLAKGQVVIVSLVDGAVRDLGSEKVPSLGTGEGEIPPLWDAGAKSVFGISDDGKLWRVDVATGAGSKVGDLPGYTIRGLVSRPGQPTICSTDEGRTVWVTARESSGDRSAIFRIDLTSGRSEPALQERKSYSGVFNLDANDATGDIAFVAKDQQHLPDVWVFNTKTGTTHQVSHLNQGMDHYELGTSRIREYRGIDGDKLRAALLLPPGYQSGQRLPLVVWVYGGTMGSNYVNSFGFWGDIAMFNMHILATRGFAVLFPDTPLHPGSPMKDLLNTVMPGVNAAIEQGFADPDRLAVSGQSYGSYSTLALIAQTKLFKAAITAAVLHPDLFSAYLEMAPDGMASSIGYYEQGQGNMGGSIWERRDRYFENSPLFLFDRLLLA